MRIACVGYRQWALSIYNKLGETTDHNIFIISSKEEYSENDIFNFNPEIILFYGWSWIIKKEIVENFKCIMLHPSPLPKYRGGSPIQNQIINDEKTSAVTLFLMDEGIDTGPIIAQKEFSLNGNLSDIFQRITDIGFELTNSFLSKTIQPQPQNERDATVFERRKIEQSEITTNEIRNESARYLHNKIRMLQDPYPNAFIRTSDGKKLFITQSHLEEA